MLRHGAPRQTQSRAGETFMKSRCRRMLRDVVRRNAKRNGEGGIRTPGRLRVTGFQDRRLQPLGHLSTQTPQGTAAACGITHATCPLLANRRRYSTASASLYVRNSRAAPGSQPRATATLVWFTESKAPSDGFSRGVGPPGQQTAPRRAPHRPSVSHRVRRRWRGAPGLGWQAPWSCVLYGRV